jgi:hypothetical protein
MTAKRLIPVAWLAARLLAVGAALSYLSAWALVYLSTPVMYSDILPERKPQPAETLDWPIPPSSWPSWAATDTIPAKPSWVNRREPAWGVSRIEFGGYGTMSSYDMVETQAGWPMRCATRSHLNYDELRPWKAVLKPPALSWHGGWNAIDRSHAIYTTVAVPVWVPLKPVWPGFAVNTLIYAGAAVAGVRSVGMVRSWMRRRRGNCPECGYPIGQAAICTECGHKRAHA